MRLPEERRKLLRSYLTEKKNIRVIEAHSGISAALVENCSSKEKPEGFHGIWMSSLTESSSKGYPDSEYLNINSRYNTLIEVLNNTSKPILFDADTGSHQEHFVLTVKKLELLGVSAVVIEDKKGLKQNSLLGKSTKQEIEDIDVFCEKIKAGKQVQKSNDFMIFARIESLILDLGLEDALKRANAYVKAGADGILIHSKSKNFDEVLEFLTEYRKVEKDTPIIVVPSTYESMTEEQAFKAGANIVIYANQLLRASVSAMEDMALGLLENGKSEGLTHNIKSCKDIINLGVK